MSVCCCSMAGTAACQHCHNNPFATSVWSNTITTDHTGTNPLENGGRHMIVYVCPNCGEPLSSFVVTTNPPIDVFECRKCGWRHESKPIGVTYIPFPESDSQ